MIRRSAAHTALGREAQDLLARGHDAPDDPVFFERGAGPCLFDVDGNRFLDLLGARGSLLLGHAPPGVVAAARAALGRGTAFGARSPAEVELARRVTAMVPSIERVRFTDSGSAAITGAIRLARTVTGRAVIARFEGGDDGPVDGLPTAVLPYNDLVAAQRLFAERGAEVAGVVVEPIATRMGVVPPRLGFLEGLRSLCDRHRALLVFDEGTTGFRVAAGGAQELYGVRPDLTTLSEIVGGGLPSGACGGRRDLMESDAPAAGTLPANPVAMAAGAALLAEVAETKPWPALEAKGARLAAGLLAACDTAGVPARVTRVGSLGTLFFLAAEPSDYASVKLADTARFAGFHAAMLERGVYLPPSQFEAWFLSTAHTEAHVDEIVEAARASLAAAATA